ncbi:alpha/beta hydrolase [Novosphingobium terrae]|uniref:alpha/beta hydrolase n=1 Tax=Novosphingobium terrae TaxID=2726189 RepID=UPI0019818509|nr:dienelactone hydrolase family protein [Novosphingobium terrae]
MRLIVTGAALLIVCAVALAFGLRRAPDMPPGPWRVQMSRSVIATRDGPHRILIWRPEGVTGPRPLILYAPGWGDRAEIGSRQLSDLASHGYVAVAFDDLSHDPPRSGESPTDAALRHARFDEATPQAYAASFALAGRRVQKAAEKGSAILDAVLASPEFGAQIDPARIGFLGFSWGGATGVEQAIADPRIKAVVNLDGWLFGEASHKVLARPYLLFYIDDDFPPDGWLRSSDPAQRALAQGCAADRAIHQPYRGRADFVWLRAGHVSHEELSGAWPGWSWRHPFAGLRDDRQALAGRQSAHAQVIRAFFDRYLQRQATAFPPIGQTYTGDITPMR